jgi:hypothetical protein
MAEVGGGWRQQTLKRFCQMAVLHPILCASGIFTLAILLTISMLVKGSW